MNYIKLLNTLGKLIKEGQIKSIDEAIQMVQKMGAQVDGLLKKGIENLFKTTKARDPDAFKGWTPKVIEGGKEKAAILADRKKTMEKFGLIEKENVYEGMIDPKSDTGKKLAKLRGKKGVENLFQETKKVDLPEGVNWKDTPLPVNPKVESFYDELVENAYKESKKTGRDVKTIIEETIDYKFTGNETGKEILDIIEKKFFKADGGRIGFNQGGNLGLTGQAKNIYDSWISAGHSSQDALNYLSSRGMYNAGSEGIESIINTQQSIIPQGGGGGNERWDPNTAQTKMFNKDVWTEIAPGKYDWVDTQVKGFMSPSGWKTAEGKNINHAGWFTGDPKAGDIKGEFPEFPGLINLGVNAFKGIRDKFTNWRANQNKIAQENLQKQIDEDNRKAAAKALSMRLAEAAAAQNAQWHTEGGGQDTPGAGGQNVTTSSGDTWGGEAYGYNEAAEKSDYYKKGGLATMFTRRR